MERQEGKKQTIRVAYKFCDIRMHIGKAANPDYHGIKQDQGKILRGNGLQFGPLYKKKVRRGRQTRREVIVCCVVDTNKNYSLFLLWGMYIAPGGRFWWIWTYSPMQYIYIFSASLEGQYILPEVLSCILRGVTGIISFWIKKTFQALKFHVLIWKIQSHSYCNERWELRMDLAREDRVKGSTTQINNNNNKWLSCVQTFGRTPALVITSATKFGIREFRMLRRHLKSTDGEIRSIRNWKVGGLSSHRRESMKQA